MSLTQPITGATAEFDYAALRRRVEAAERRSQEGDDPTRRRRAVLAACAAIAAAPERAALGESTPVVAFRVGGARFGVPASDVEQVLQPARISPLPRSPAWLLGATMVRTRVVPILDLRQLLCLAGGTIRDLPDLVVVAFEEQVVGVAVEEVEGLVELPRSGVRPAPAGPFRFIGPDGIPVLDVERLVRAQGAAPTTP